MIKKAAIEMAKPPVAGAKPWVGKPPLTMAQLPKECGAVLTSGGFEPPIPGEAGTVPTALKAMATKDAGPPIPTLTAAQLKELTGGADSAGMPLPDRNPIR
jgi:penicillin-insensitive murein DD-endopeptidase